MSRECGNHTGIFGQMGEEQKNKDKISGAADSLQDDPAQNYGAKTGAADQEKKDEYKFLDQVIKKKPVDRKAVATRILITVLCGVAIGVIAAFVFAATVPLARKALGQDADTQKVDIQASSGSSEVVASSSVVSAISESDSTSASSGAVSTTSEEQPSSEEDQAAAALDSYKNLHQDMLDVAEQAKQAVVIVTGIQDEMDYFKQNIENKKQVSGLIVAENDENYYILTEYRAVKDVERIQVTFCDNSVADAIFQKADSNTGLAVLKVAMSGVAQETQSSIALAPFGNSYAIEQGEPVLAIGSPLGYNDSVAFGVITSTTNKVSKSDCEYRLLTTDIEGSTEGSGILVDLDGKVVGIIDQSMSTVEGNSTIIGLAISQITDLIEDLSNNTARTYAGIVGETVTREISSKTGIPEGMLVQSVDDSSPAMLAGIKQYDVITEIGDTEITSVSSYSSALEKYKKDDKVQMKALRKGNEGYVEVTFDVTLSEK